MGFTRSSAIVISSLLLVLMVVAPTQASTQPSIPISGRYSALVIKIYIPSSPKWAHDVVLNATLAWNRAQVWNQQNSNSGTVYQFVETDDGSATAIVSFSMPAAYAGIAVGWTEYKFAPGSRSTVVSTMTYLDPAVFNQAQATNMTAQRYALWLSLHELGRILGLGSILDGQDIMEPRYTPQRVSQVPRLSTLDLYALQVLAQGSAPAFVTLPDGVQNQLTAVTFFEAPFKLQSNLNILQDLRVQLPQVWVIQFPFYKTPFMFIV